MESLGISPIMDSEPNQGIAKTKIKANAGGKTNSAAVNVLNYLQDDQFCRVKKPISLGDKIGSFPFKGPDGKVVKTLAYVSDSAKQGCLILNFVHKDEILFKTFYDKKENKFILLDSDSTVKMTDDAKLFRKNLTDEVINKSAFQLIEDRMKFKVKGPSPTKRIPEHLKVPCNLTKALEFLNKRLKIRL